MKVAFNNMGAKKLPELVPYKEEGLSGWIRAAGDFGFRAFQFDEFFRNADFPTSVGIQVDTSHFRYPGMSLLGAIQQWSERLYDIHANDVTEFVWTDRETWLSTIFDDVHLPIGHGILDFTEIVRTLKNGGYDDWLTLELYHKNVQSLEDHIQSRKRLEAIISEFRDPNIRRRHHDVN